MQKVILFFVFILLNGASAQHYKTVYIPPESIRRWNKADSQNMTSVDYRLPDIYEVYDYYIFIDVYLDEKGPSNENFTLTGAVMINFKLKNDTNKIIFHNDGLVILEYNLNKINEPTLNDLELDSEPLKNFFILTRKSKENFTIGNYSLFIKYDGKLGDLGKDGFSPCNYVNSKNETVWVKKIISRL